MGAAKAQGGNRAVPPEGAAGSVFVCYPREQSGFVEQLRRLLERRKVSCWIDLSGVPPGSPKWTEDVLGGIRRSEAFVVVMSAATVKSRACIEEMRYAVETGKKLIVLQREDPGDTEALPDTVNDSGWIAAQPDRTIDEVVAAVVFALQVEYEWTQAHTRLLTGAEWWDQGNRSRGRLLRGADLDEMERAVAKYASSDLQPVRPLQRSFVEASRRAATRGRRLRTALVSTAFAVLSGMLVFALIQRSQALRQRDTAVSRELASSSGDRVSADPALAVTLARLANERSRTPQAELALQRALLGSHIERTLRPSGQPEDLTGIALAPEGRAAVLANGANVDSQIVDFARRRRVVIPTGRGHGGGLAFARFSPDGRRLLTLDYDRRATLWDAHALKPLASWRAGDEAFVGATFTTDRVFIVNLSGNVVVRGLHGERKLTPRWLAGRQVLALSDDAHHALELGQRASLLIASPGRRVPLGIRGRMVTASFAPDGRRLAIDISSRGIALWTVAHPRRVARLGGNRGGFTSTGRAYVVVDSDGVLRYFSAHSGKLERRVPGFPAEPDIVQPVGPKGDHAVIAVGDGQIAQWDTRSRTDPLATYAFERHAHEPGQILGHHLAYTVGSGGSDSVEVLTIWDVRSGKVVARRRLPPQRGALVVDPSGRFAAVWTIAARVGHLLPLRGGPVRAVPGEAAVFSADGRHLIVYAQKSLGVFSMPSLEKEGSFSAPLKDAPSLAASADGSRIAVGDGQSVAVYDWPAGEVRFVKKRASLAFATSLNGNARLVAVKAGPTTQILAAANGRLQRVLSTVDEGAFAPYGDIVGTVRNRTVTLWSAVAGDRLATFRLSRKAETLSFSPDGGTIMVGNGDGSATFLPCTVCQPLEALMREAKERVDRPLTPLERASYLTR